MAGGDRTHSLTHSLTHAHTCGPATSHTSTSMSAPHSQPHSLTPSLQPIPAEECMSESQAALWRSFLQCSGGLGPAAALPAFRTAFRMAGLALLGAEEEEE